MDLLLTHGYYLYEDPKERAVMRPYPPLGILYISSHLKGRGFEVAVFDTTFSNSEQFDEYVKRERPPVVGIYATLMTRVNVLEQIRVCKQHGAIVVVGGPEPVNYASEYLGHGADIVVAGEGELTLEELLPHLARHGLAALDAIAGIAYAGDDGGVVHTEPRPFIDDLDGQPLPDRGAIDIERYIDAWRRHHGVGSVSVITARGCPYTCTWCSHGVYGFSHRRRSPLNVADEVEIIRDTYRPDMLWYADDVFTLQPGWIRNFAAELGRRGLRLPFETITREDRLNEQIIRTLAEMGCRRLWIGSESGSQRILDAMQRRTDAERVRRMVRLLKKHGIEAGMFIMLGYDGETLADLDATAEHLKDALPDRFLTTLAYPIKGTPYHDVVADRIVPLKAWAEGSDRDLTVAGRHSRRFYRHASRWIVNELNWSKERRAGRRSYTKLAKAFVFAKASRVGMRLTQHAVER